MSIPSDIRTSLSFLKELASDGDAEAICSAVAESLVSETPQSGWLGVASTIPTIVGEYDTARMHSLCTAIACVYTDAARNNAQQLHSAFWSDVVTMLSHTLKIPTARVDAVVRCYKEVEGQLKSISAASSTIASSSTSVPTIHDVSVAVHHVLGDREVDPREPSTAMFDVSFGTSSTENVSMRCSVAQMQDMVTTLKDMIKQAERSSSGL